MSLQALPLHLLKEGTNTHFTCLWNTKRDDVLEEPHTRPDIVETFTLLPIPI